MIHGDIPMSDVAAYLSHFGVKGMKWGVRNEPKQGRDITLAKNTKIYNISMNEQRSLDGAVYGAHKKRDVLNYRGTYAGNLLNFRGADKVFSNSFTVKKDVRAAGQIAQLEAFKTLWETDKDGVARALAESQKDMKFSAAFNARILKLDRENVYHQRFMKKGDDWVNGKGFQEFTSSLGAENDKSRSLFFSEMSKRGYNAVIDMNDVRNYGSEQPILVFKGSKNLKKDHVVELTETDISKALDAWYSRKILDQYDLDTIHGTG